MRTIRLDELGEPAHVRLSPHEGHALASSGVVRAERDPYDSGLWIVRDAGKVGVARIGDLEVWIQPKVRIDRLLFLLGYAIHPKGWQEDTAGLRSNEDLVPALAHALWRQGERALAQGLLQGYRVHEETAPVLRGRLRETEQLRRHHGLPHPLEIRYDEFTVDIPENRILRAAVERMLRLPRVDAGARQRLQRLRARLVDVTPVIRGEPLPGWHASRLNARYHVALRLAEIIWHGTSVEQDPGPVSVNGFLIDMPKVFEDFVTVALGEELRHRGGRVRRQYSCFLDVASCVRLHPDLVWHQRGEPVGVVDAKYKAERYSGFPDADLYQLLAYCTALRLSRGHLVYAKGNEQPARHTVRNAGVDITCHALDLQQEPGELLSQIADLAADIAGDATSDKGFTQSVVSL